jgi:shikimate kinase
MKNIVLVGFMGTGKTSVARALSRKLGMKYVSTDEFIEKKEKTSIADIFSGKGENYFRKAEKDAVKGLSLMENVVIDAGGGAVTDPENVEHLKKKGIIVCLWAEPEVILDRTKKYTHRPLLNVGNPLEKIRELLMVRKPFYERADYHIHTSKMTPGQVVEEIERTVKNA